MDPRHSRRLAALVLFFGCLILTTWLDANFGFDDFKLLGRSRSKRSAVDNAEFKTLLRENKVRNDQQYERVRLHLMKKHVIKDIKENDSIETAFSKIGDKNSKPLQEKKRVYSLVKESAKKKAAALSDDAHDEDFVEDTGDTYLTIIEDRVKQIRKKVYQCLPKFICEVHSQSQDKISTDIEREWLNLYSPSLLTGQLHEFQSAAHMGQLFRGYQPSPCNQLYTGCPITMQQIKTFLSTLDIKKTRV